MFLFAGDAYRTADPTPTQQRQFAEALLPLIEAGIPVAMVVGNHDHPVSFGKASSVDIFGVLDGRVDAATTSRRAHSGGRASLPSRNAIANAAEMVVSPPTGTTRSSACTAATRTAPASPWPSPG